MSADSNVIVVGVDDSESSRAAMRWAATYARGTGCRLLAVHVLVWPLAADLYAYSVVADQLYTDASYVEERYRAPSQASFDAVHPEPDWTLQFAQGDPGRVLVNLSRTAQLLVVGAREHRGIGRLLNGSVGHYSLNHASCPVVMVPREGPEPADRREVRENARQD